MQVKLEEKDERMWCEMKFDARLSEND